MNEAAANISWLPFDPRDWEQLTPAFGRYRSLVDEPNNFVANNLAARCFDRNVHNGLLELALVRADGMYRLFDAAERQKLNIRVPLNYREGCGIEPFYAGRWYARRSDLDKLTTIPSRPHASKQSLPPRGPRRPSCRKLNSSLSSHHLPLSRTSRPARSRLRMW